MVGENGFRKQTPVVESVYVTSYKAMNPQLRKTNSNVSVTLQDQPKLISEVRKAIEKHKSIEKIKQRLGDEYTRFCSDESISRYLRARNWNIKKAEKMLEASLVWRMNYKPEEIRWNSKSTRAQIKYLVYCMENAILNLPPEQEQMVWLIDFHGFNDANTKNVMESLFYMDKLESAFGGKNEAKFDLKIYADRMKEDDAKRLALYKGASSSGTTSGRASTVSLDFSIANTDSDSDGEKKTPTEINEEAILAEAQKIAAADGGGRGARIEA
ncbi:CRAL-TRIO domain-containing protein [Cynara cardunculus var. scolymus]|uniref:CRAL-TRIO domain-containing protein n=1 Tax=Cynara cardunculus var. scolymus TaxID=59895 RepID=A0A118JYF8_CYNCS|nr:CRAL-TRIO domain-containing protein [Cynara cardunculus var. scolymus]